MHIAYMHVPLLCLDVVFGFNFWDHAWTKTTNHGQQIHEHYHSVNFSLIHEIYLKIIKG